MLKKQKTKPKKKKNYSYNEKSTRFRVLININKCTHQSTNDTKRRSRRNLITKVLVIMFVQEKLWGGCILVPLINQQSR